VGCFHLLRGRLRVAAGADVDFQLLRLGGFLLMQRDRENSVLVARLCGIRLDRGVQNETANEAAIPAFDPVEVLFFFVLYELAFALDRQGLVLKVDQEVLLRNSRHLQLQHQAVRVLIDIHWRDEVTGTEAFILQLAVRAGEIVEDGVQPILEYRNAFQRRTEQSESSWS
jgi:hypothetical protein